MPSRSDNFPAQSLSVASHGFLLPSSSWPGLGLLTLSLQTELPLPPMCQISLPSGTLPMLPPLPEHSPPSSPSHFTWLTPTHRNHHFLSEISTPAPSEGGFPKAQPPLRAQHFLQLLQLLIPWWVFPARLLAPSKKSMGSSDFAHCPVIVSDWKSHGTL